MGSLLFALLSWRKVAKSRGNDMVGLLSVMLFARSVCVLEWSLGSSWCCVVALRMLVTGLLVVGMLLVLCFPPLDRWVSIMFSVLNCSLFLRSGPNAGPLQMRWSFDTRGRVGSQPIGSHMRWVVSLVVWRGASLVLNV